MRTSRPSPTINSGSMADIAFLLLIFFLVTTTISGDEGFNRKLPEDCPLGMDCSTPIKERNILRININNSNELMVEQEMVSVEEVKDAVKEFIDNNGDKSCSYCGGLGAEESSDNPSKAVVSLQTGNLASYEFYIVVQNEITKAYYELRETYAKTIFKKNAVDLSEDEMKQVKEAYPFILSEADTR